MPILSIFGRDLIDDSCVRQLENCIEEEDLAVLTADAHYGYNHPIGGAIAYRNKISVSGVGFDIGCGNKAVRTDIIAEQVNIKGVMDEIVKRISFGMGRPNNEPVDHEVFDKISEAEFKPQRNLLKLAKEQLGTVGSGNHYVDLFSDEDGMLWVGVHFGSRGFGHKTAKGFMALAKGKNFEEHVNEGSMDAPPILLDMDSAMGQDYFQAMSLAGEYAYAGRDSVVKKVMSILGANETFSVHNHHNFAWKESHFGSEYWVVRKGCTPAFPGQQSFVGSNMFDESVIIEGVNTETAQNSLFSTVHGAGRIMSRNEAAGKSKWTKNEKGQRVKVFVKRGKVDFDRVITLAHEKGIVLRGGAADESPQCYKNLAEVLSRQGDSVRIKHRLKPLGVAMAGSDLLDPYKD